MVRIHLAAGLLAAAGVARALSETPSIVPGAYIVEYENDEDSGSFVNKIHGDVELRKDLRFALFKGASIQFANTENAETAAEEIAKMPEVKNVWPVKTYQIPDYTVHSAGNAAVHETMNKRQVTANDTFSTHLMTQVNKFRDAGITGKGIKIAIIDTGIDYLHPALGGCFGEGCVVTYGEDLVGDNYNGRNTPRPDRDPLDNCNGHGTHVAGIIAAQSNNPFGIIGAAQGVSLGGYRVFGCQGNVDNDVLIAAYNKAFEAGSDIITASIGGPSGWADDPWAVVVSRIVENGVACVVSAGNDGSAGLFYPSTAANGRRVTAIGSVDNSISPALLTNASYTVNDTNARAFGFTEGDPPSWTNIRLPLYAVGFNTSAEADGCDPLPSSTPSLSGYVVLIRRGSCTFVQKAQNAIARGARYIIFYNNVAGTATVTAAAAGLSAVAMVTADQGEAWIADLKAGNRVVVSMPNPQTASKFLSNSANSQTGGQVSGFTSWGPTFEVELKPQFSAPGGLILSTYPRSLGSYGVLSGTSMSCPLIAAIYALVMSVRGTKDPRILENVLAATAQPIRYQPGTGTPVSNLLAPVPQQGAGIVQAWDAAQATTILSTSSLSFNDTDHFSPVQNFTIHNTAKTDITYKLSHLAAATGYTFANESTIVPASFPVEVNANVASLSFDPSEDLVIPAGERRVVSVRATPPTGLNAKRLPVYSGYIAINGSDGSASSLPYIGVAGSLRSVTVLDRRGSRLSRSNSRENVAVDSNQSFTLPPAGRANETMYIGRTILPKLVISLSMGSAYVKGEVVPLSAGSTTGGTPIGQLKDFPALFNPRGVLTLEWAGQLADGKYAPAGRYKIVVSALKIFGDRGVASDFEVLETVPFAINYMPVRTRRSIPRVRANRDE